MIGDYDWNIICTDYVNNISINVGKKFNILTKPISFWQFDEESTTLSIDSVGDNNGTIINATRVNGIKNNALEFTGSASYVSVPNSTELNPTSQLTLAGWIKWNIDPLTGDLWTAIINKGNDNQYRLQHNQTNTLFEFAIRNPNNRFVYSTTSPVQGQWYFVVGTYDGTDLKIYVNGEHENTLNTIGGPINIRPEDFRIASRSSNDRYFNGIIDEVTIYDIALNEEEIKLIYDLIIN